MFSGELEITRLLAVEDITEEVLELYREGKITNRSGITIDITFSNACEIQGLIPQSS